MLRYWFGERLAESARSAWRPPDTRNGPDRIGALQGVEPMTLAEQLAHLRQLTITDPREPRLDEDQSLTV